MAEKTEVLKLVRDFYNAVLSEKPENVYEYAGDFFDAYAQKWIIIILLFF